MLFGSATKSRAGPGTQTYQLNIVAKQGLRMEEPYSNLTSTSMRSLSYKGLLLHFNDGQLG